MFVIFDGDLCVTRCMVQAPHVIWLPSGSTVAAVRHHTSSRLDIFVSIFIRCFKWISDIICFGASIEENNSFDTLFLCVINNQNIFAIIHNWDIFLGQSGGILMYSDILIFNELEIQGISRAHTLHSAALLVAIVIVYLVCGWLR